MKLARPIGFSLFLNIRCVSGTTDLFSRSPFLNEKLAPSGAFLANIIPWDDPELCELIANVDRQFGHNLGDDIEEA